VKAVIRRPRDANSAGGWLLLWLPGAGQARTGNGTPRRKTMPGWPRPGTGHPRTIAAGPRPVPPTRPFGAGATPDLAMTMKAQVKTARAMPIGGPGVGEPGDPQVPGIASRPDPVAGISSDTVGAPAADPGDARSGQESIWPPSPASE
jgi:hypothetical protein